MSASVMELAYKEALYQVFCTFSSLPLLDSRISYMSGQVSNLHRVTEKREHQNFVHNFNKSENIFVIFGTHHRDNLEN